MSNSYVDFLISTLQEDTETRYVIKSKAVQGNWYFFDIEIDAKTHHVEWIPYISGAVKFNSEQSVEEFASQFLSPRPVEIIRLT